MLIKCLATLFLTFVTFVGLGRSDGIGDAIERETTGEKKLGVATSLVHLADHAYAPLADSTIPSEANGAVLLKFQSDDSITGFKAKTYKLGDELVVAFAGTEISASAIEEWKNYLKSQVRSVQLVGLAGPLVLYGLSGNGPPQVPPDVKADAELAIGSRPAQFRQAVDFVRAARKQNSGKPVLLTGHSLGGGLAMYSARTEGDYAVTFNAAFLNSKLRSDAATRPSARIFAFEAVRDSGIVRRDAVSAASRWWFGKDPHVQVIDVAVDKKDALLHGLKHFMESDRKLVNWVKTQALPVKSLEGGPTPVSLEKGVAVFRLSPGEMGMTDIVFVASRDGYVSSLYVDADDTKTLGTVTTPEGAPLNVRRKPDTTQAGIAKLWRGDEVSPLQEVTGQEVTRAANKSAVWFRIQTIVLRSGRVDSKGLTDDPNQAVSVPVNVTANESVHFR